MTTAETQCATCTVPTSGTELCSFCQTYLPPAPDVWTVPAELTGSDPVTVEVVREGEGYVAINGLLLSASAVLVLAVLLSHISRELEQAARS
ncbi:MAG: hypothetical protein WA988_13215 [Candidatus Nanopelagicales bacterium]